MAIPTSPLKMCVEKNMPQRLGAGGWDCLVFASVVGVKQTSANPTSKRSSMDAFLVRVTDDLSQEVEVEVEVEVEDNQLRI